MLVAAELDQCFDGQRLTTRAGLFGLRGHRRRDPSLRAAARRVDRVVVDVSLHGANGPESTFPEQHTNSARNADRLAEGNLSINHLVVSSAETPFGGVKDSGIGHTGDVEGL
jgi:Aldehyde dehydrogenase family